jgi:hypothetical protein
MMKKYKLVFIVIAFLIGLYYCFIYNSKCVKETFVSNNCPNLLIKKGNQLHLVNTKKTMVPGVNPIKFNNLEEYSEYVSWSQKVGIKCPILYYEETYNTQNEKGFRLLDDPMNPSAGLPSNLHQRPAQTRQLRDANRDDPPYNQNSYAGVDVQDQHIGVKTPLDNIKMDKNQLVKLTNSMYKN